MSLLWLRSLPPLNVTSAAPPSGPICDICIAILRTAETRDPSRNYDGFRTGGTHHSTAQSLRSSTMQGCLVCCAVERGIHRNNGTDDMQSSGDSFTRYIYSVQTAGPRPLSGSLEFRGHQMPGCTIASFCLQGTRDEPHFLKANKSSQSSSSTKSFELIRKWISRCDSRHARCKSARSIPFQLPTRLLEVQDSSRPSIRVVDVKKEGVVGNYNTLSYCWGSTNGVRLLSSNIEQFQKGIPVTDLPRTLADAVEVTRSMGVPYLWIDALCIIQDSTADWEQEATRMGEVYSNSYCNLAARHGNDSNAGLFVPRKPGTMQPILLTIRWPQHRAETMRLMDRNLWADRIDDSPLNKRGWAFQERMLPRRSIHFAHNQILFECYEAKLCEGFSGIIPNFLCFQRETPQRRKTKLDYGGTRRPWANHLWTYTDCDLTEQKDRLVAISGVAKSMALQTGDEYVAGLWRKSLPRALLWRPVDSQQTSRPTTYRAPSWSWASINGQIWWPSYHFEESLVEVMSCEAVTATGDPFGVCTGGRLTLRCRTHVARISNGKIEGVSVSDSIGWDFSDLSQEMNNLAAGVESSAELLFVQILTQRLGNLDPPEPDSSSWLVLRPTGIVVGEYKRFGMTEGLGWPLDGLLERTGSLATITIV